MKYKKISSLLIALFVILMTVGLLTIKQLRVAFPTLLPGITCQTTTLCTDDVAKLEDAQKLYRTGYEHATTAVGPFIGSPKVVFCSTERCAEMFGMEKRAAAAIGDLGLIIAPRGWTPFYLTHEMIHYRQAESFGNLAMLTKPSWLIEGMAYSMSGDPRRLGAPFDEWRTQFDMWHATLGTQPVLQAAKVIK
ncbi:hypothetical protein M6G53_21005 [Serratia nevei]|uniref:hypothetical protein n=1 Tax=Serratia nevei TaxID=2703794 RepID=UPI0020A09B24|nr:hypothetical protein [Serratia nevei]MCP1107855.1 hypothetical protein [Serratia nevei]